MSDAASMGGRVERLMALALRARENGNTTYADLMVERAAALFDEPGDHTTEAKRSYTAAANLVSQNKAPPAVKSSHSRAAICGGRNRRTFHKTGVPTMATNKPGKPVDLDQPTETAMEGEIREFLRRDGVNLRRAPDTDSEVVASNISALLQRVSGASVQEIDRLMAELETLRNHLHSESTRVQREITEFAHLSQSAMQSTRIIVESLASWKHGGSDARTARG